MKGLGDPLNLAKFAKEFDEVRCDEIFNEFKNTFNDIKIEYSDEDED